LVGFGAVAGGRDAVVATGTVVGVVGAVATAAVVGTFVMGGRVPTTEIRDVGTTAVVVREGTGESSALE
jgi:hypothetical protein